MNQQTLILLKPDALKRQLDQKIVDIFLRNGFHIVYQRKVKVKKDIILHHYQEVIDRLKLDYLPQAILNEFEHELVSIIIFSHRHHDAIALGRQVIGATDPSKASPETIRGQFGEDTLPRSIEEKRMLRNLIHASDSMEAVRRECQLWLGVELNQLLKLQD